MSERIPPPDFTKDSDVVAICCSDIHLSPKPPIYRSAELDWLATQLDGLNQVKSLAKKHQCPIIVAGDLFDRPRPDVSFVNMVIEWMQGPKWFCVPGQHDLLHHSYIDVKRTAYWTLVKAGVITNLPPNEPLEYWVKKYPIRMHGFPWGTTVEPNKDPKDMILEIAVIHQYCWKKGVGEYPGVSANHRVKAYWPKLKGFDVALFGDNHQPHETQGKETLIYNSGTFFRRKRSERGLWPTIGLLHADNRMTRHQLDISKDKFLEDDLMHESSEVLVNELVDELNKAGDSDVDFKASIIRRVSGEREEVKQVILRALEVA